MLAFLQRIRYDSQVSSTWLVGQAVKTSPSHGENSGSIPLRAAHCFYNSPTRKTQTFLSVSFCVIGNSSNFLLHKKRSAGMHTLLLRNMSQKCDAKAAQNIAKRYSLFRILKIPLENSWNSNLIPRLKSVTMSAVTEKRKGIWL